MSHVHPQDRQAHWFVNIPHPTGRPTERQAGSAPQLQSQWVKHTYCRLRLSQLISPEQGVSPLVETMQPHVAQSKVTGLVSSLHSRDEGP